MPTPSLPVELHIAILTHLTLGRDPASTKTLAAFLAANSVTRAAALDNAVWQNLYRGRYTHAVPAHEAERRVRWQASSREPTSRSGCGPRLRHSASDYDAGLGSLSGLDWRSMFVERHELDLRALRLLDLARTRVNGEDGVKGPAVLLAQMSFDVWDALEIESRVPVPRAFRDPNVDDMEEEPVPDALQRRYWARAAQGAIARSHAVAMWGRILRGEEGCTFDDVLAGFSAFYDVSPYYIYKQLDELAARCRSRLFGDGAELNPQSSGYDLAQLAVSTRAFIHDEGFAVAQGGAFFFPLNEFPHYFLNEGRSKTLPISINYVFCAVCSRLGIQAAPTNTPRDILTHITSPNPHKGDILIDPCAKDAPIVYSSRDLVVQLAEAGMPPSAAADTVRPADLQSIAERALHNILCIDPWRCSEYGTAVVQDRPRYAVKVLFAIVNAAMGGPFMPPVPEDCPLDSEMVAGALAPIVLEGQQLDAFAPRQIDQRGSSQEDIVVSHALLPRPKDVAMKAFIGQVVESHGGQGLGCVVGWFTERNRPQRLRPIGPSPITYRVLTKTGFDYYGELAVKPVQLTPERLSWLFKHVYMFNKFFVDAYVPHADGTGGRLIPIPELQAQYPDDLEVGKRWSEEQLHKA